MVFKKAGIWAVANILFSLLRGLLPIVMIILIKVIVDDVIQLRSEDSSDNQMAHILMVFYFLCALFFTNIICTYLSRIAAQKQSLLVTENMYSLLHNKTTRLNLSYYENPVYFDMLYRAGREVSFRPGLIIANIIQIVQAAVTLLLVVILLFDFHWSFVFVLLLTGVPLIWINLKSSSKIVAWEKQRTSQNRIGEYYNRVLTQPVFAKEMRLFRLKDFFIDRFSKNLKDRNKSYFTLFRKRAFIDMIVQLCAAMLVFCFVGFIASNAAFGLISVGAMIMYFLAMQRGFMYMSSLIKAIAGLYENNLFVISFFELIEIKEEQEDATDCIPFKGKIEESIILKDVSFKYPDSNRAVLKDLNLKIPAGKSIALVGDNGSGKSTLVKLLCRLYKPDKGSVKLDGVDYCSISDQDYSQLISVIFQDYVLYNLSAAENIMLGNSKEINTERMHAAARQAGIDDLIQSLPNAYETMLGKLFSDSEELSIGEWQKLALARAFYKEAQLIILDEPTSALDAAAEAELIAKFFELTKDKTSVIVSHRFSTVKTADIIYVLDNQKIMEAGSHDELMAQNGKYARMYTLQSSFYK